MDNWQSNRTPVPPHPFAHWVAGDDWIIVSGTVGLAPDFSIPDDFEQQARFAVANLETSLAQAGATLSDIVFMKPYVTDAAYVPILDVVLDELLPTPRAAGGALSITQLAMPAFKIEFEAWARRGAQLTAWEPGGTAEETVS